MGYESVIHDSKPIAYVPRCRCQSSQHRSAADDSPARWVHDAEWRSAVVRQRVSGDKVRVNVDGSDGGRVIHNGEGGQSSKSMRSCGQAT